MTERYDSKALGSEIGDIRKGQRLLIEFIDEPTATFPDFHLRNVRPSQPVEG